MTFSMTNQSAIHPDIHEADTGTDELIRRTCSADACMLNWLISPGVFYVDQAHTCCGEGLGGLKVDEFPPDGQ